MNKQERELYKAVSRLSPLDKAAWLREHRDTLLRISPTYAWVCYRAGDFDTKETS